MKTGSVIIVLLLSLALGGCRSHRAVLEERKSDALTDSVMTENRDEMVIFAQEGDTEFEELILEGVRASDSVINYKVRLRKTRMTKKRSGALKTQIADSVNKKTRQSTKTFGRTEKTSETKTMPIKGEQMAIILAVMITAGVIIFKRIRRKTR